MSISKSILLLICTVSAAACATKDAEHRVVISVPDQKMAVFQQNTLIAEYDVSTSKFGVGSREGSYATPLGHLEVADKIGAGAPAGAVFRDRRPTGEVLRPNAPGRDPIVSRILWLRGLDPGNSNAFGRCIYIHGTAEERNIGKPVSYGCIRMRSRDVIRLFNALGVGTTVQIINAPLMPPGPEKQEFVKNQPKPVFETEPLIHNVLIRG